MADYGFLVPTGGGEDIPLKKNRIVVGRRETCDVVLRFPNVSGSHCELCVVEGYWFIKDLGSSNGTKVNGSRISEQRVAPGDKISIAKHVFEIAYEPLKLGATTMMIETVQPADPFSRSLLDVAGLETKHSEPKTKQVTDSKKIDGQSVSRKNHR